MHLNFDLHPAQMQVFQDPARLKVVSAGRRFGKSHLAAMECLIQALQQENKYGYDVTGTAVYYIAPTFDQAKRAVWNKFIYELGKDVIVNINKNEGILYLVNNREIHLKGADRPDTLRGAKLGFCVMDEFAFMKPDVWNKIVRPALADVKGGALFIGTPDGKNHFFDLYNDARKSRTADDDERPEWAAFTFTSQDNPTIPIDDEILSARRDGVPEEILRQEYFASFHASGGKVFKEDSLRYGEEPRDGFYYIAVDPAGYEDVSTNSSSRLDDTAIAVVKVGPFGWYVAEIIAGRWNIRETSVRILKAAQDYEVMAVGIEQGSLKNAVMPYLDDQMRRIGVYPRVVPVSHGGKKKTERIAWALQGRLDHGRLILPDDGGPWIRKFINQMLDFPNPLSHDDMLDALAYIDQVATAVYADMDEFEEWEPIDAVAGY